MALHMLLQISGFSEARAALSAIVRSGPLIIRILFVLLDFFLNWTKHTHPLQILLPNQGVPREGKKKNLGFCENYRCEVLKTLEDDSIIYLVVGLDMGRDERFLRSANTAVIAVVAPYVSEDRRRKRDGFFFFSSSSFSFSIFFFFFFFLWSHRIGNHIRQRNLRFLRVWRCF